MTGGGRTYPDDPAGPFPTPPRTVEDREGRDIRYRAVDAGAVADITAMYVDFDTGDRAQGIPPTGEERIREWLEEILPLGYNVVALDDDRVVGHATLVPDGDGAYELAIFVLNAYQGAGIGTHLMETLLGHGTDEGVERVWLTVEPWNGAAIHIYEKVGFERVPNGGFEREYTIRLA